jgi:hypothetical protein
MHNYEATHGKLPAAAVCGYDGTPLLSWRVAILPFVEGDALYKEFRLDEAWDSPHNLKLLERMPAVYAAPGSKKSKLPKYHTICHVFQGKGTAFEGCEPLKFDDIKDGTSNTIFIVEAGKPVPWTKPEELEYDSDRPLPDLTGVFKDGMIRVGMGDGSVRYIYPQKISQKTLRAAITRDDGQPLGNDW